MFIYSTLKRIISSSSSSKNTKTSSVCILNLIIKTNAHISFLFSSSPPKMSRTVILLIVFCALTLVFIFSLPNNLLHHSIHDDDSNQHEDHHVMKVILKDTVTSDNAEKGTTATTKSPRRVSPRSQKLSSSAKVEIDPENLLIDPLPPAPSVIEKVAVPIINDHQQSSSSSLPSKLLRQVQNGMQPKFLVSNIGVKNNKIYFFTTSAASSASEKLPSKIYLPDGQVGPMKQNHKYTGHDIKFVSTSSEQFKCKTHVKRPTVFLYRMSGHSTYHLWENNLGPFYQTLLDFEKDFPASLMSSSSAASKLFDPSQLLIVFTDNKPRKGPKNPHLLDQLLKTFTDTPLINASRIVSTDGESMVCFDKAILGISANSYRMRPLVELMKKNVLRGEEKRSGSSTRNNNNDHQDGDVRAVSSTKRELSSLNAVYISRNHPSIIRGRKIHNEEEFVEMLNKTLIENGVKSGIQKVFMEQMTYAQQVAFATTVDIMFSPHGGGVANCIWMKQKSVMVEFVAPVGKTLPNMYHSMCSRSGIKHFSFLADPDPDDEKNTDPVYLSNKRLFSNMMMPVERIRENVEKAIKLWSGK